MATLESIVTYKRGTATNKQRTVYKWYLYIGGLCVGETTATADYISQRLNEIYQEIRQKTAAEIDPAPSE